jgi:hypothetical protein
MREVVRIPKVPILIWELLSHGDVLASRRGRALRRRSVGLSYDRTTAGAHVDFNAAGLDYSTPAANILAPWFQRHGPHICSVMPGARQRQWWWLLGAMLTSATMA